MNFADIVRPCDLIEILRRPKWRLLNLETGQYETSLLNNNADINNTDLELAVAATAELKRCQNISQMEEPKRTSFLTWLATLYNATTS